MIGQMAMAGAGGLKILATDGGNHSAQDWARITTADLIAIDPSAAPDRRHAAVALRSTVAGILVAAFSEIRPTSSFADVSAIVSGAMSLIQDAFAGTPWQMGFENPEIKAMAESVIRRNLLTAADLAVRTE